MKMKGLIRCVAFSVCVSVFVGGISGKSGVAAPAPSNVFIVNDVSYVGDAHPGDGVCDTGSGNCTLLAAIQEANESPGPNTVVLAAGTYPASGLRVSGDLEIKGAGATDTFIGYCGLVRPGILEGLFLVEPSVKVDITGVTITRCLSEFGGGCVHNNGGDLTIKHSKVTNCDSFGVGGGIRSFNNGNLTITHSEISHNNAEADGGISIVGGNLTISHSQITANWEHLGGGGGIVTHGGTATTILQSEITGNRGLLVGGISNGGIMTIEHTDVTENGSSLEVGGGIYNIGDLTIKASEITGNAPGADISNTGTLKLKSTTVGDCVGCP